jgi:hypothetical protein
MSHETALPDPIPAMLQNAFHHIIGPQCLNDSTLAPEKGQGLYSLQFMYKNTAGKDVAGLLQQAEKEIAPLQVTCNPPAGAPIWITVFANAKVVAEQRTQEVTKTRIGADGDLARALVQTVLGRIENSDPSWADVTMALRASVASYAPVVAAIVGTEQAPGCLGTILARMSH